MSDVRFIDTTVRDGNQSLWALNMRTDHMLAVAEHIDEAGFESVEFFVTVMFKKLVREQKEKENAWDWFRLDTQRFTMTRRRPGSSPSARDRGSSISKSSVGLAYAAGGTQRRRALAGPEASAGAGTHRVQP